MKREYETENKKKEKCENGRNSTLRLRVFDRGEEGTVDAVSANVKRAFFVSKHATKSRREK